MPGTIIEPKTGTLVRGLHCSGVNCGSCKALSLCDSEGDPCPHCPAATAEEPTPLYLREMDYYKDNGVVARLEELRKNETPARVKRTSGGWTPCTVQTHAYGFKVVVQWVRESDGKELQKTINTYEFIESNRPLFSDIENPVGPKE